MTPVDLHIEAPPCFQLKGGLFTLTAVQLLSTDLQAFSAQLEDKIKQAPKFFYRAPVVIDLQRLSKEGPSINFAQVLKSLQACHLIPVGIRGGSAELQESAIEAGLALLPESKADRSVYESHSKTAASAEAAAPAKITATPPKSLPAETNDTPTRLITQPVRSGQQVYARGGDLLVLAPVSHGAELLADGHIHVYAPLRGRALAGVSGDTTACIFCHSLEAELVSIAGQYRVSEDLKDTHWKSSVRIQLLNNVLSIEPLCTN